MAAVTSPIDGTAFARLHRGLKSSEEEHWREMDPKPVPIVRRQSSTTGMKRIAFATSNICPRSEHEGRDDQGSMGMLQDGRVSTGVSKVLDSDSGLQLSMKANSILGANTWAQGNAEFLKLDSKGT
eukprot:sb/3475581/